VPAGCPRPLPPAILGGVAMKKKWILPPCPDESVDRARRFIQPSLHELSDPADHPALSEAAAFLRDAVAAGKRITVFGDYDADGICATALGLRWTSISPTAWKKATA